MKEQKWPYFYQLNMFSRENWARFPWKTSGSVGYAQTVPDKTKRRQKRLYRHIPVLSLAWAGWAEIWSNPNIQTLQTVLTQRNHLFSKGTTPFSLENMIQWLKIRSHVFPDLTKSLNVGLLWGLYMLYHLLFFPPRWLFDRKTNLFLKQMLIYQESHVQIPEGTHI